MRILKAIPCANSNRCEHLPSYLLDVVVAQSTAILELLAGEDQALLVRGDTLLVLDLGLDVVDGVARLDVEGNGLTRQGLDETIVRKNSQQMFLFRSYCRLFIFIWQSRIEISEVDRLGK